MNAKVLDIKHKNADAEIDHEAQPITFAFSNQLEMETLWRSV